MSPMDTQSTLLKTTSTRRKEERIECRVTREQKADILAAAEIDGLSVSDFMMKYSLEAARKLSLQERNSFVISEDDWPKLFLEKMSPEEEARIAKARECFRDYGINFNEQGFEGSDRVRTS